jgi:membrane-associated phospholipid phosphatase
MNIQIKIATFISKIFEPMILIPLAFILYATHAGVPFAETLLLFVTVLGPIAGYRVWMQKKQGIDWDIKDRAKRGKPFMKLIIFSILINIGIWILEPRLLSLCLLFLIWTIGFYFITTRYTKISGHVGGDALATGLLIQSFGWRYWPVLLIVPIVAWSRVVRKDHTLAQVIAGAVYSWFVVLVSSVMFQVS